MKYKRKLFVCQDQIHFIPGELNNPVWCTYGPCPNCAYLIGQDGMIDTIQTWFSVGEIEKAIDRLLGGE